MIKPTFKVGDMVSWDTKGDFLLGKKTIVRITKVDNVQRLSRAYYSIELIDASGRRFGGIVEGNLCKLDVDDLPAVLAQT